MREDQIYIDKKTFTAYTVDHEFKIIYAYDCKIIDGGYPTIYNEGLLEAVNTDIASEIEKYFHIDTTNYGIEILDEEIEIEIANSDIKISTNKISPKKEYDKALQRLISTIIKINQKELPNTKELAKEFNVSDKTIQNDIYKRLSHLPIYKQNNRFCFPDSFVWNYCLKNKKD